MTDGLERLFAPESIALLGASNRPDKHGHLVARRLAEGFAGRLWPVHPREATVVGLPALPDLAALPEPVDLVAALLPGRRLVEAIEACPAGKARFLVAIPAGFGEHSAEGRALERALVEAARARGMRVVGPNCMGMLDAARGVNASLVPILPPGGPGLSLLTQSGGFGITAALFAEAHGLHLATLCDLGNSADLQPEEVLGHLARDPETRMIGIYLEAARRPERFRRALAHAAAHKPVIMCPLGHSPAGGRASFAHLGLAPGLEDAPLDVPVIAAETGLELLEIAKALAWQPRPAGRRAAIVVATGGIGTELADLAVACGLEVPELSPALREALAAHLPPHASARNPIDLTPVWWNHDSVYPAVLEALGASAEIDLVLVAVTDVWTSLEGLPAAIAGPRMDKPLYVSWIGAMDGGAHMRRLEAAGIPCYPGTRAQVRAAAACVRTARLWGSTA